MLKSIGRLLALCGALCALPACAQITPLSKLPAVSGAVSPGAVIPASQGGVTYGLTPPQIVQAGGAASLTSPALTGIPTAPTPASGDNSTRIATTSFVGQALSAQFMQGFTYVGPLGIDGAGNYLTLESGSGTVNGYLYQGLGGSVNLTYGLHQNSSGAQVATATQGASLGLSPDGSLNLSSFTGATIGQAPTLKVAMNISAQGSTLYSPLAVSGLGTNVSFNSGAPNLAYMYEGPGGALNLTTGYYVASDGTHYATATQGGLLSVGSTGLLNYDYFTGATIGQSPTLVTVFSTTPTSLTLAAGIGLCLHATTDCVTYSASAGKFYFTNASGQTIASLSDSGDFRIVGQVYPGATP